MPFLRFWKLAAIGFSPIKLNNKQIFDLGADMIDPIDLILRALEEGNAPDVGVQAMIPEDFVDSYSAFTGMVAAALQGVGGDRLLENYMGQPELWGDTLAKALVEAGADQDEALLEAAQQFMSLMNVRQAGRGGYTIDVVDEDDEDDDDVDDDDDDLIDEGLEDGLDEDDLDEDDLDNHDLGDDLDDDGGPDADDFVDADQRSNALLPDDLLEDDYPPEQ
jgi:hypothetical protein